MRKTLASAVLLGLVGLAGCPDIKTDPDEMGNGVLEPGPTVQFDPAASVIPFPNNLLLNPLNGRVNLPETCGETIAARLIRGTLLNTLDGFGTYQTALQVQLSEQVDVASLEGRIWLHQKTRGGAPIPPSSVTRIPVVTQVGTAVQYSADCKTSRQVTSLTIIPLGVLEPHATYSVALTRGIKTPGTNGEEFQPSLTWALASQAESPVAFDSSGLVFKNETPLDPREPAQLAQLQGINLLHNLLKPVVDFAVATGKQRSDLLIAWEFTTQSTDALDPTVAGTPAAVALAGTTPLQGITSLIAGGETPIEALTRLGFPCAVLPCAAVGNVLVAGVVAADYQIKMPNPLGGTPVPSSWTDPRRPTAVNDENVLQVFAFVPAGTMPEGGWPTVVFGHGLTGSKENLGLIAPQLAGAGFASVAIDFVAHGSRAVRVANAGDCADGPEDPEDPESPVGPPSPSRKPQCFAPILSNDLAQTRDNIRQTVLDLMSLVASLKACGPESCEGLPLNPARITYMGMSLGGIIGSTLVAQVADIKGAVLNVPGVGLLDIVEHTESLAIRCNLVDGLIGAGILVGATSGMTDALCLDPAKTWKSQAGYQQFSAIARWALDPADGANFTAKLAGRKILIQEVKDDLVVPNISTDREAALVGLQVAAADPLLPSLEPPLPSTAILNAMTTSKFVLYSNVAAAEGFVGNTFQHSSLLEPVTSPADPPLPAPSAGFLGTLRLQTDAIGFLTFNNN